MHEFAAENDSRRAGTIWALNLDEPVPALRPRVEAVFRRLDPDLVPALVAATGRDSAAVEILQRFETGRRCYTAWVGDQLASYGWVSFDEEHIGELNLRIRLLPGEVYIWDCATIPVFRRNYLYSALLGFVIRELREEYCRAWIGADMDNLPSQQGIARAGFHHIGDLVIERVLAIRQVWVQGRLGVPDHMVAEARRAFLNDRDKIWKTVVSVAAQSRTG